MAILIASNLRKELSGTPLFDGVSFKVERRDRLALAGANGAGKTTLLRALTGELSLEGGRARLGEGRTRGAARPASAGGERAAAARLRARRHRRPRRTRAASCAGSKPRWPPARTTRERSPATGARRRGSSTRAATTGATAPRAVVRGLGFSDGELERPLSTFSGGELTRASLARALAAQPDLLLLDEPTNHLDIETIEWLEELLRTIDAGVIVVAHDRWFLEAVTTAVLELDRGRSVFFPGKWHLWRREQAARALHAAKSAERDADKIAQLERFVERFGAKNTKAKQAKSKQKQIDRLKRQHGRGAAPAARRSLGFEFLEAGALGPGRDRGRGLSTCAPATSSCFARPRSRSSGASTSRCRPQRLGQDDAARDDARPSRARRGAGQARPRGRGRLLLPARGRARRARLGARRRRRRHRPAPPATHRSCSAGSSSRAGRSTRSPSPPSRAASGGG